MRDPTKTLTDYLTSREVLYRIRASVPDSVPGACSTQVRWTPAGNLHLVLHRAAAGRPAERASAIIAPHKLTARDEAAVVAYLDDLVAELFRRFSEVPADVGGEG